MPVKLSPQAESLLAAMARDQGLRKLAFNEEGLIPIKLGADLQIAIAFSEANNSFYVMGVLNPRGAEEIDAWWAFEHSRSLSPRRTRIAVEPTSGALVLVRDIFLNGIEYWEFSAALDQFVRDFEEAAGLLKTAGAFGGSFEDDLLQASSESILILRP